MRRQDKADRIGEILDDLYPDPAKRAEIYVEVQKLILADAINVFLGYPSRAIGAASTVQNLLLSPLGNIVLRDVDLA